LKKLIGLLFGLIIVALIAVFIGPSFVDWNSYKPEITAAVEKETGRKLTIGGAIDLQILPSPRLSVANVRLSNASDAADPDMIRLDSLQVHVALGPLMSGAVQISSVTLIRPVISLERFADGSGNWEFGSTGSSAGNAVPSQSEGKAGVGAGIAVSLDSAEIIDGSVIFRDAGAAQTHRFEDLDATIIATSLGGPFSAKGGMIYQGLKTDFAANLGQIDLGRPAAAKLAVDLPSIGGGASFEGTVDISAGLSVVGKVTVTAKNLHDASRSLASAVGTEIELPPILAKALDINAKIDSNPAKVDVTDVVVQLGDARLQGAVAVVLSEIISVDASLALGRLDLDKFGLFTTEGSPAQVSDTTAGGGDAPDDALNFTLPGNMRVKLAVSADAIDHGGRTVRQLRVEGQLDQGAVSVDVLTAQLPGGTNVTVTGTVYADAGQPRFVGRADVVSDNLRTALNWLEVPLDGLAADRLRKGVFRADIDASPKQVDLTNWTVDVDNTSIGGGLSLLLRDRPAFGLSLVVDKVNLDAYLPASASAGAAGAAAGANVNPSKGDNADITKLLSSFDANLLIKVKEARYRNTTIRGAALDATIQSGEIVIRDLSVVDVGGAALEVTGKLAGTVVEPSTDIKVKITAKSAAKLARFAGVEVTETVQKLGGFEFQSKVLGSPSSLTVDAVLKIAQARLETKGVVKPLESPIGLDLALKFSHPRVEKFLARLDKGFADSGLILGPGTLTGAVLTRADQGFDIDSTLNLATGRMAVKGLVQAFTDKPGIDARITLDHPDVVTLIRMGAPDFKPSRRDLGPFSLNVALVGGATALKFEALSLRAGPVSFAGQGSADLGGARPKFTVRLATDAIMVDPWLAPDTPKPKGAAAAAVPIRASGREWSRERIDMSALGLFDAGIDLSAKKVVYGTYIVDGATLKAELAGGRLTVSEFKGGLFGGRVAGTGRLDSIGTTAAEMLFKVENADIRAAALAMADKGQVSGILDYETQLSTRGASEFDMVSALQGVGKFRIQDGSVEGIDLPAVSEQLKKLDGALDFLKLAQRAMNGGATPIDELTGTYTITDGVLRSDDVALSSKVAAGKTNVAVNLPGQEVDARSRFWLAEHPNSPPIGVRHVGSMSNPRTVLDIEKLQAYVLQRVVQRGILRQFDGGKKPTADAVLPGAEGEADKANPLPALDKLKPRDALKGILKGLLN
jgi:uncharacterized protein involved in outer membrane biogenesis